MANKSPIANQSSVQKTVDEILPDVLAEAIGAVIKETRQKLQVQIDDLRAKVFRLEQVNKSYSAQSFSSKSAPQNRRIQTIGFD